MFGLGNLFNGAVGFVGGFVDLIFQAVGGFIHLFTGFFG